MALEVRPALRSPFELATSRKNIERDKADMKPTLRIAALAFCILSACGASRADGLTGSTVTGTLNEGTLSDPFMTILGSKTAVVGSSSPTFPAGSILGDSAFQIDITSDQIIYRPLQNVTYNNDPFNGFEFTFTGAPTILGVTLDAASNFTPTGFSFTGNSVTLNLSADTVNTSSVAILDLSLAPSGPPTGTPEPATWALMLISMGAIGAMARSRRKTLMTAA